MKEDSELKRQTVQPAQTTQPPTQNDNSIMIDMRKQLRQQSYQNDQREQEDRSDTIRLKGVDYVEQENLKQTVIEVASTMDVVLRPQDIRGCFRIGERNGPTNKGPILIKLAYRSKKIAMMRNKKKLAPGRFIEEDLTKLRSTIYHKVRMDNNTSNTWT